VTTLLSALSVLSVPIHPPSENRTPLCGLRVRCITRQCLRGATPSPPGRNWAVRPAGAAPAKLGEASEAPFRERSERKGPQLNLRVKS